MGNLFDESENRKNKIGVSVYKEIRVKKRSRNLRMSDLIYKRKNIKILFFFLTKIKEKKSSGGWT